MEMDDTGRFSDPSLLILTSLADGPKHGYAMTRDIEDFGGVALGPGTLYGAIARLEESGLIEALPAEDRRKPYRLTRDGSHELAARLRGMARFAATGLARLGAASESDCK
ncbi:MAG: PadR family transcriptional regulator [Gemmatimonadota bacterium]